MPDNKINKNKFIKPNRNSNILNYKTPNNTNRPNKNYNKTNNKIKVNNGFTRPNKTNTTRRSKK